MTELTTAVPETEARKPWSPPQLIVSSMRNTDSHVTRFTDGTTPFIGPYGS